MIWLIDQFDDVYYGTDLYGIRIWASPHGSNSVKIFCEERRYRYSGTLYSKLNSLINMMCYNKYFTAKDLVGSDVEDNCFFITFRYDICEFVRQYARKLWEAPSPIEGEYFNKIYYHNNAYFIDN